MGRGQGALGCGDEVPGGLWRERERQRAREFRRNEPPEKKIKKKKAELTTPCAELRRR